MRFVLQKKQNGYLGIRIYSKVFNTLIRCVLLISKGASLSFASDSNYKVQHLKFSVLIPMELILPIFVTSEYHHIYFGYSLPQGVDMCPLLKALGQPVDVCNLYILDDCFIDNHSTFSFYTFSYFIQKIYIHVFKFPHNYFYMILDSLLIP